MLRPDSADTLPDWHPSPAWIEIDPHMRCLLYCVILLLTAALARAQEPPPVPGLESEPPAAELIPGEVWEPAVPVGQPYYGASEGLGPRNRPNEPWHWQILPDGLIYRSYLAGVKEPRFQSIWFHDKNLGWKWDSTLGGRVGILRYGTGDSQWPEGWQLDMEGAAFPRLDMEDEFDVNSTDFRFGIPLTYGEGPYQTKLAYYHLSSHLGDEFLIKNPTFPRINYVRDAIVWGHSYYYTNDLRLYAEAEYAFKTDGGAKPWAFQFGADFSPAYPTGIRGAPFAAVNAYLREDFNFGGHFVVQTGWQWRGGYTNKLFRVGLHYLNGKSPEWEFFDRFEQQLGFGMWYDF